MSNLNQLEREWKAYKSKKRRPFVIASLTFIILASLMTFLFLDTKRTKELPTKNQVTLNSQPQLKQKTSVVVKPQESNHTIEAAKITKQVTATAKVQELQPSFTFMKQIKEQRHPKKQKQVKKTSSKHHIEKKRPVVKKERISTHTATRNKIDVSSTSSKDKIDTLAKRFNSNRNPHLGIAVAKRYLQSKKYKQAYFYALEVNNIDPRNEDSWLVSAHALYFIKSKESAMNLLKKYMRKHNSAKALRLYRAMQKGRLK